jgi:hypothetical protein
LRGAAILGNNKSDPEDEARTGRGNVDREERRGERECGNG